MSLIKKLIAVFIIITLIFSLAACGKQEKKRYEAEFLLLFDTVTQIVGYTETKEEFAAQVDLIYESLKEYHQLYDIYNNYDGINNIKTINDQAGIAPVKVDQKIIDLLLFSREAFELTDGKVNAAFGAVLKIWHDYRDAGTENPENAALPEMTLLQEASGHTDFEQVIIDEENATVYLPDPEMSLDVGAIAKGYATEQVGRLAEENGMTSGLLSVGGNVRAIGVKGDSNGTPWKVGIQNPVDQNGKDLNKIRLMNASLVTSGIYERFYIVNGKSYHHIIDPITLFPAEYFLSVTVLCPDSGLADALSTSIFNMPYEQGLALIESLPETEALWVFHDGQRKSSSKFKDSIAE
ncbi:MAG: FAD:protein FMN transferase [Eubacteriales bacterium]|nr:FAD:protein FMN transferase [Eubacteriales bacterium]